MPINETGWLITALGTPDLDSVSYNESVAWAKFNARTNDGGSPVNANTKGYRAVLIQITEVATNSTAEAGSTEDAV